MARFSCAWSLALRSLFTAIERSFPPGALAHHVHVVAGMGIPYWLGYVSAFTEFIGGILLVLGLLTRLAAAFVAINMFVAFFTVGIHPRPRQL